MPRGRRTRGVVVTGRIKEQGPVFRLEIKRAQNLRPALVPAARELKRMIRDSFRRQESPHEERWPPLASSTLKRKQAEGTARLGPLKRTREMFKKISVRTTKFGIRLQTLAYAVFHHTDGRIPRRAILPVNTRFEFDLTRGRAAAWGRKTMDRLIGYVAGGGR